MIRASDLNDSVAGVTALIGDDQLVVTAAAALQDIRDGILTWVRPGTDEARLERLAALPVRAAVVCDPATADCLKDNQQLVLLVASNPRLALLRLVSRFFPTSTPPVGVHPLATVHPSAEIDPSASVGAFCHVGLRCKVGARTILYPHVVLYEGVSLGDDVIIHSGTTIGADGFGYERNERGELERFPHIGSVIVEDEVEIGSNSNVDRGALGNTILRRGCKIDNQVHIGHNADLGEDVAVTAHSLVGGSVVIGKGAFVAPSSVIMNQMRIGAGAFVGMGAVVTRSVADGETVMGVPAERDSEFKALRAALRRLVSQTETG